MTEEYIGSDLPPPTPDEVLRTALDVGAGLLRSGGEIRRVEDTITRICKYYGAVHVEAFTITSLIIASVRMPDGGYSNQTRRILRSGNDLHKLDMYNTVSRDICGGRLTIPQAQERMRLIKKSVPYPAWVRYIGAILGTGAFAVFFGGNTADAAAAAVIGVIMTTLEIYRPSYINDMSQAVISSFAAGILSYIFVRIGFGDSIDKVLIGTIMLLIPGLTIGTSIRDMLNGDILSGFMRLGQSVLLAVIIALGYGGALVLMREVLS